MCLYPFVSLERLCGATNVWFSTVSLYRSCVCASNLYPEGDFQLLHCVYHQHLVQHRFLEHFNVSHKSNIQSVTGEHELTSAQSANRIRLKATSVRFLTNLEKTTVEYHSNEANTAAVSSSNQILSLTNHSSIEKETSLLGMRFGKP